MSNRPEIKVGNIPGADEMPYYFHYIDCPQCDGGKEGGLCPVCDSAGFVGLRPLEEVEIVAIEQQVKPKFGDMPQADHVTAMRRAPKEGDRSALNMMRRTKSVATKRLVLFRKSC